MNILEDKIQTDLALVLGNFDGVHLGHQALFSSAMQFGKFGALSFYPHPRSHFEQSESSFLLMSFKDKKEEIRSLGAENIWHILFDDALTKLSPIDFLDAVKSNFKPKAIIVGEDFKFGHRRAGDPSLIKEWGNTHDIETLCVPTVMSGNEKVSSSRIRKELTNGNVAEANKLLSRPHYLSGVVMQGDQRGRELGMPTANLYPSEVMLPKFGIYASYIHIRTGKYKGVYQGASSLGVRPHFGVNAPNFETFILDFEGDIYGEEIKVELIEYLRGEAKFENLDALISQMKNDVNMTRQILTQNARYA